jgi:hypothetical protein
MHECARSVNIRLVVSATVVRSKHEKPNFRSLLLNFLAKFSIYGTLSPIEPPARAKANMGNEGEKESGWRRARDKAWIFLIWIRRNRLKSPDSLE